jgi:hypothetical protein
MHSGPGLGYDVATGWEILDQDVVLEARVGDEDG